MIHRNKNLYQENKSSLLCNDGKWYAVIVNTLGDKFKSKIAQLLN